jgi:hypothetical protein
MGFFSWVKRQGLEADHMPRLRKFEIYLYSPLRLQVIMLN